MSKVHLAQIIFLVVQVFAAVTLTAAVLGDMDPDILSASAIAFGAGLIGNAICAVIRAVQGSKKK